MFYSLYLGLFKKYSLYLGFSQRPSIDTFLVVSRRGNSSADHVFRFNKAKSLCLFGPLNPIRRFAIRLVTNKYPFKQRSTYSKNVQMPMYPANSGFARPDATLRNASVTPTANVI